MMKAPVASIEARKLSALARSAYSFRDIAASIERIDTGEGMVLQPKLEQSGLAIEPFWQDEGDLEGECYLSYIAAHPEFTLQVRAGVARRLLQAASLLPASWQIVLKAGYRPFEVQLALLEAMRQESVRKFPARTDAEHTEHARTFVADPVIVCPPHNTGGAVDLLIRDKETGEIVDMGCPPNADDERAYLFSDSISEQAKANRLVLLTAMLEAGFAPNPNEWWHYQYGETYWAAFYGHKATQYDLLTV